MADCGFHDGWRFGRYEFHADMNRLTLGKDLVRLSDTEIGLLRVLVQAQGETVDKAKFLSAVKSPAALSDDNLSVYLHRLRKKLDDGTIVNLRGVGYRLGGEIEPLGTVEELRALHLTALYAKAERERQNLPDRQWDEHYLPTADEVRASLDWAFERAARKHIAIALTGASARLWERLSELAEGRRYLDRAVALLDDTVRPAHAALLLKQAGTILRESDRQRSLSLFNRAMQLYCELDDKARLGDLLGLIGAAYIDLGNEEAARSTLMEAHGLLVLTGQSKALWNVLNSLGRLHSTPDASGDAMRYFRMATDVARLLEDPLREHIVTVNLGELEFALGALDRAIERAREAVRGLAGTPLNYRVRPIVNLSTYLALQGDVAGARAAATTALGMAAEQGGYWLRLCVLCWAFLADSEGRSPEAAQLLGFVDEQFARNKDARQAPEQLLTNRIVSSLESKMSPESLQVWSGEGAEWNETQAARVIRIRLLAEASAS
jgi:DNA-binding winged helix-turn-helix (wHTH) protein